MSTGSRRSPPVSTCCRLRSTWRFGAPRACRPTDTGQTAQGAYEGEVGGFKGVMKPVSPADPRPPYHLTILEPGACAQQLSKKTPTYLDRGDICIPADSYPGLVLENQCTVQDAALVPPPPHPLLYRIRLQIRPGRYGNLDGTQRVYMDYLARAEGAM